MIARKVYRLLLYLHPLTFRERFAREMLWVFDQSAGDESILTLLADVAFSLLKQHLATDTAPRCANSLFQQTHADHLHVLRFFQAGAVGLPLFIGFILLLQQPVPLPKPPRDVAVRRYIPDVCGELVVAARPSEQLGGSQKMPDVSRVRR